MRRVLTVRMAQLELVAASAGIPSCAGLQRQQQRREPTRLSVTNIGAASRVSRLPPRPQWNFLTQRPASFTSLGQLSLRYRNTMWHKKVMAVVGDEGIPAAASGSDATDRPPSEIRRQLLLSLGYEAKHGFVNVVSSVTGKQFSDVLVELVEALEGSEEGLHLNGSAGKLAASYARLAPEKRRIAVDEIRSQLGGQQKQEEIEVRTPPTRAAEAPQALALAVQPVPIMMDLETSGFNRDENLITEIAAYAPLSGARFEQLLLIGDTKLSERIVKITGITNDLLEEEGVAPRTAFESFIEFVNRQSEGSNTTPILVAHNGRRFDFPFLISHMAAAGLAMPSGWLALDSLELARQFLPSLKHHKLGTLREHFELPELNAHRAMPDAITLSGVVSGILNRISPSVSEAQRTLVQLSFPVNSVAPTGDAPSSLLSSPPRTSPAPGSPPSAATSGSGSSARIIGSSGRLERGEKDGGGLSDSQGLGALARERTTAPNPSASPLAGAVVAPSLPIAAGLADFETLETYRLPVSKCKDLTPTMRNKLLEARIEDIESLVTSCAPRGYISFDENHLVEGASVALTGVVQRSNVVAVRPALAVLNLQLSVQTRTEDGSEGYETVHISKFMSGGYARPALWKLSSRFPEGSACVAKGKVTCDRSGRWEMKDKPDLLTTEQWSGQRSSDAAGAVQAVYPALTPLSAKDFSKIMPRALKALRGSPCAEDPLPGDLRQRQDLMEFLPAISAVHFPPDKATLRLARRRMAFQELFMLQLGLVMRRSAAIDGDAKEEGCLVLKPCEAAAVEGAVSALPFRLTDGQSAAVCDLLADLQSGHPMLRLLQGDVGSGKTVVAFLGMLAAASAGWQAALMAPTEVLVAQHKKNLDALLARMADLGLPTPTCAVLTGSTRVAERRRILQGLAEEGSLQLVIGTHSLISSTIEFRRLGLIVIDEQHRFGVEQRALLQRSVEPTPHVLTLSATPIPRTLALVAHGDMDISVIAERPPGRLPVTTRVLKASAASRELAHDAIRREVAAGFRAYVVCPLVESSDADGFEEVRAAEEEYEELKESGCLGDAAVGLLHGRLSGEEKDEALAAFAEGRTQVLITTTVVEVGVDVAEASVMVVEHAERFGLAQLHQLRGRIGRGTRASECILLAAGNAKSTERLSVLEGSEDGFLIAEADLAQRGPGEVLGTRQSGASAYAALRYTKLPEDAALLEAAHDEATALMTQPGGPSALPLRLWAAYAASALPQLDFTLFPGASLTAAASLSTASVGDEPISQES